MRDAGNHAYDYAERIRDRLPRRLQELREAESLSNPSAAAQWAAGA